MKYVHFFALFQAANVVARCVTCSFPPGRDFMNFDSFYSSMNGDGVTAKARREMFKCIWLYFARISR